MKATFKILSVIFITLLIFSCSRDDDNNGGNNNGNTIEGITVTTIDITNVKTILATANSKVEVDVTKATLTAKGIVWSTSTNPTIALTTKTIENSTAGNYQSPLTDLQHSTKYYVRAYATDNKGNTVYGNEISFITKIGWQKIITGSDCFFGIKKDGSLWAWGNNSTGQLGDGTNTSQNRPVQISNDKDWKEVVTGRSVGAGGNQTGFYTLAIKNDGSLWAWGDNTQGHLGDGTNITKFIPTKIGNSQWLKVSIGKTAAMGIKLDGTVWAWGYVANPNLQQYSIFNIPTQLTGITNCKDLLSTDLGGVFIKNDGTLWTYGYGNNYIRLLLGVSAGNYFPFQQVGSSNNWLKLYCGDEFMSSIAIKTDGSTWGWGRNHGLFGDGTNNGVLNFSVFSNNLNSIDLSMPTNSIVPENRMTVLVKTDNTLWGTGSGVYGDGVLNSVKYVFTQIGLINKWQQVCVGSNIFATQINGSLWVCGKNNTNGQLGIGDNNPSTQKLTFTLIE